jgi:hypothetical protein
VQLDDVVDLPLDQLEVLATCSGEVPLVEVGAVGVLEVTGEVGGGIGQFIGSVPDEEIIASPEGGSI